MPDFIPCTCPFQHDIIFTMKYLYLMIAGMNNAGNCIWITIWGDYMLIFFRETIVFHTAEWLTFIKHAVHAIIHKDIRYCAIRQRHSVRSKAGYRRVLLYMI
jgi:hypothetical protein